MEWFKVYTDWNDAINLLTDEEAGQMLKAVYAYVLRGEKRNGRDRLELFLATVYNALSRDKEKYDLAVAEEKQKKEERQEHARHAAEARWKRQQEKQLGACGEQNEHIWACKNKNIDKDIDTDKDTEKEKDSEREREERETTEETEDKYDYSSEPPSADSEQPVIRIPLKNGSGYSIYQRDVDKYAKLYPAADVEQELRNMKGWCLANPTKRKTINGVNRFINGWLCKAQDKGGRKQEVPENPFLAYARGEKEIGDWIF